MIPKYAVRDWLHWPAFKLAVLCDRAVTNHVGRACQGTQDMQARVDTVVQHVCENVKARVKERTNR